jgi:hypothetical protein
MKSSANSAKRKPHSSWRHGSRDIQSPPTRDQKFDPESGQVYLETEVTYNKRQHSDWMGASGHQGRVRIPRPTGNGARSLAEMAKSQVAMNFRHLTSEHFESIPWAVAENIWKELLQL